MKNSNFWNIVSNYGSKVWGLVSVFIFIPLYIKYLGIESYGVVGFSALLMGILSFADGGLSSAIIKEFSAENSFSYKYSLLKSIEKIYSIICIAVFFLIFFCAPYISKYWLTSNSISIDKLTYYIRLIGVNIVLQLISSLYFGAIFGLNYQVKANVIQVTWNISRSLGVVLVLILIRPTLEFFFIWQIICNIIYVLFLRYKTYDVLKRKSIEKLVTLFKKIPKDVVKYISGMILIAIVSSINFQADKIVTSASFSLILYGYYNLASSLASIPMLVSTPLAISVFPLFSNFVSTLNENSAKICFCKVSLLINLIIIIIGTTIILYTKDILILWTKNAIEYNYQNDVIFLIRMLTIGFMLQSFQLISFYSLLSKGKTKYNIYQGMTQVIVGIPLLILFVKLYGLKGAGISWVVISFGAFIYLNFVNFKYHLDLKFSRFFIKTYFIPLLSILVIFIFIYAINYLLNFHFFIPIIISVILSIFVNIILVNYRKKLPIFELSNFFDFSND